MNMKLKVIAAACLAMCASSAFAATLTPAQIAAAAAAAAVPATICGTATAADAIVNSCAPQVKMFIAGSSALGDALGKVVVKDLFDTTTQPIISVVDTSGGPQASSTKAWYGMSKSSLTTASKWLYVVYNKNNGSAAGVSQLLGATKTAAEAVVVSVGPKTAKTGGSNSCVLASTSTTLVPVVNCVSTDVVTAADMAISDVHPAELYKLYPTATAKLSTLTSTPLALQGFGVAVSWDLYVALQNRNIAEGLLASTCAASTATTCQPSVRSADYASLVTTQGSIKTATAFLGDTTDLNSLTLARRDDLSGTQASSNIFFADNSCGGMGYGLGGTNYGTTGVATVNGFNYSPATSKLDKTLSAIMGGGLEVIGSKNITAATSTTPVIVNNDTTQFPGLVIMSNSTGSGVTTQLNAAAVSPATVNYSIGVISLNSGAPSGAAGTWKYVKLDGVSPNYDAAGNVAYNMRTQFANGNYPFAMTAYAVVPVKPAAGSVGDTAKGFPAVINAVIKGMQDSTLHDLQGIAYLDGALAQSTDLGPKQALVHRTAGNNCSPLIK